MTRRGSGFRLVLLAVILEVMATSCGQQGEQSQRPGTPKGATPAKKTLTKIFDHRLRDHAGIICQTCHARNLEVPAAVKMQRPGHNTCSGCHSRENYLNAAVSEPLCATCHNAKILNIALETRLLPFPKELKQFGVRGFSHRTHLDEAKMAGHPDGFGCQFCHRDAAPIAPPDAPPDSLDDSPKGFPHHAECYSCHIHQAGQKSGRCEDCHAPAAESMAYVREDGAATRDYNFRHSTHTKKKDGTAIPCEECHGLAAVPPVQITPKLSDIVRMVTARGQQHQSTCFGACHIQKDEPMCGKCHISGVPLPARAG